VHFLIFGLVALAVVVMQILKGGWIFAASLPAYGILAVAGLVSWLPLRRLDLPRSALLPLIAAACFFAYMLGRTLLSPVVFIARPDLFTLLGAPIVYLAITFYVRSPKLRVWLVALLLLLGCINGVVGSLQYFKGENFMVFSLLPRADYGTRASGFFGNPNQLAGFLEVALLLGVSVAWWGRWRLWGRILIAYGALMCGAVLLITVSRGGYASVTVGLFVFIVLSFTVKNRKGRGNLPVIALAVTVLAITLAGTAYMVLKGSDVLQSRVSATTGDVPFRASLWKAAIRQFTLSPALGTGSATYLYYGRMFRDSTVQTDPIYSHNDYLQLLAEFGLLGMAGFLFFLATHLRAGWQAIRQLTLHLRNSRLAEGSNSLALSIGAISCVAAFLVHSLVDFNLHIPANALVMALVFGLLANPGSIPTSSKTGQHAPTFALPFAVRLLPPALGAWIFVVGTPLAAAAFYAHRVDRILADWRYMDKPEIAREAEKFARLGLERDPQNLELYRALGDIQFALAFLSSHLPEVREKYLAESVETYQRALALAPMDRNLVLGLAWTCDEMRRFAESEKLFQRALELDPNSSQVRSAYAGHLEMQGRIAEAVKEYERAAEMGAPSAYHALNRIRSAPKAPRTGAEDDAPKVGR
jgi:O-antigen ligase